MFDDNGDLIIFLIVVGLRLIVPLFIPRFPLPAIIAAMLLDAADQTIFQKWTTIDTGASYQSYDKALDIYYLTIAYLSTMRNWGNLTAFEAGRFLLYYRLIGVLIYEFTHERWVLFIFPNTFEYFFIFYEAIRLRWNPKRMSPKVVWGAVAFIWIFIKLPQEYWIHIAQNDVTDTLKEHPGLIPVIAVVVVALIAAGYWIVKHKCPPADWSPSFTDPMKREGTDVNYNNAERRLFAGRGFDRALVEKVILVSLICVIFGQILPNSNVGDVTLAIGVAAVIIGNMFVSELLRKRDVQWKNLMRQFIAMFLVNAAIAGGIILFFSRDNDGGASVNRGNLAFFLFLITILVVLFDAFRPFYRQRLEASQLRAVD